MLEIKEEFHKAGIVYSWPGNPEGIGIKKPLLGGEGNFDISLKGKTYKIEKKKARKLATRYNSFFTTSYGSVLAVIPLWAFENR